MCKKFATNSIWICKPYISTLAFFVDLILSSLDIGYWKGQGSHDWMLSYFLSVCVTSRSVIRDVRALISHYLSMRKNEVLFHCCRSSLTNSFFRECWYLVTVKYHFVRRQRPLSTTKFVRNTRHLGLPTHIEGPSAQAKGSYIEI